MSTEKNSFYVANFERSQIINNTIIHETQIDCKVGLTIRQIHLKKLQNILTKSLCKTLYNLITSTKCPKNGVHGIHFYVQSGVHCTLLSILYLHLHDRAEKRTEADLTKMYILKNVTLFSYFLARPQFRHLQKCFPLLLLQKAFLIPNKCIKQVCLAEPKNCTN